MLSDEERERYSRHLILDEIGVSGQQTLKESAVLCVGTGGLGSPVLLYLAAAGVGRLGVVDFDNVEESNLQRQVIHGTSTVGQSKVKSATERLRDLNPNIHVDCYEEALTRENALDIFQHFDVIVDGTDNFPTRYLVNDACVLLDKPFVYGSIFKFEGQCSVFNYRGGPNYRDLYPEPPPPGLVPSCAEGGVLGILPGVIGTLQATEAIKVLLGLGETLSGRLLTYNALTMKFREFVLKSDPHAQPITGLIDYHGFCGVQDADPSAHKAREIGARELRDKLKTTDVHLIDVREANEWAEGHIQGAVLIPLGELERRMGELPQSGHIVAYCKLGGRSKKACEILAKNGFEDLFTLSGGILAYREEFERDPHAS